MKQLPLLLSLILLAGPVAAQTTRVSDIIDIYDQEVNHVLTAAAAPGAVGPCAFTIRTGTGRPDAVRRASSMQATRSPTRQKLWMLSCRRCSTTNQRPQYASSSKMTGLPSGRFRRPST